MCARHTDREGTGLRPKILRTPFLIQNLRAIPLNPLLANDDVYK
ncbi:hypothetical protein JMJ77_0009104 [Colletotrichum scovillei]|uniref:Uncharacterized protein n=1 Tax=Colletotrichum scovillei TaxID=1209932 RepID=A0A9P7QZF0_9PEZI|nr:hypothetical protein JMJ77_0009104 [Colletotrichum scovillei]KAG7052179.1 hypothetical protein JMJ78_0005201 [Colletotrichum scovillei]KAG7064468.1 hypothetical protein JMJ76_0012233 [Colletotrichum scovillei]